MGGDRDGGRQGWEGQGWRETGMEGDKDGRDRDGGRQGWRETRMGETGMEGDRKRGRQRKTRRWR